MSEIYARGVRYSLRRVRTVNEEGEIYFEIFMESAKSI